MTQYPPTNPYQTPAMLREAPGATAGMVLGIVSIVFIFPVISFILALIGYQKSKTAKQLCDLNPGMFSNEGVATAGYVLCIIGMILGVVSSICVCGYFIFIFLFFGVGLAGAAASGGGAGGILW